MAATNLTLTPIRTKIIETIQASDQSLPPSEIARAAGLNPNTVRREVTTLTRCGRLTRTGNGYQIAPGYRQVTTPNPLPVPGPGAVRRSRPELTGPDRLAVDHLHLVDMVINRAARNLPAHIDRDDLRSETTAALYEAARRYDPATGVPFPAYAIRRLKGAVIDALRHTDTATRSARRIVREAETAREKLGRTATPDQIAEAVGVTRSRLTAAQTATTHHARLDDPNLAAAETVADTATLDPAALVEQQATIRMLHDAIRTLPPRAATIIYQHDFQGRRLIDIAEEMGVTVSRVSQIRSEALVRLRAALTTD